MHKMWFYQCSKSSGMINRRYDTLFGTLSKFEISVPDPRKHITLRALMLKINDSLRQARRFHFLIVGRICEIVERNVKFNSQAYLVYPIFRTKWMSISDSTTLSTEAAMTVDLLSTFQSALLSNLLRMFMNKDLSNLLSEADWNCT